MIKYIKYWFWVRRAMKAVANGKTASCYVCRDPIVPGDYIGAGLDNENQRVFVHAGFHSSLSSMDAYCTTGIIGTGYWDGKYMQNIHESIASRAVRTKTVQTGNR